MHTPLYIYTDVTYSYIHRVFCCAQDANDIFTHVFLYHFHPFPCFKCHTSRLVEINRCNNTSSLGAKNGAQRCRFVVSKDRCEPRSTGPLCLVFLPHRFVVVDMMTWQPLAGVLGRGEEQQVCISRRVNNKKHQKTPTFRGLFATLKP